MDPVVAPYAPATIPLVGWPQPTTFTAPKPARVMHVINGEHYAGAERVQDLLALRLGEFGYEVGFACLKPGRFVGQRRSQSAPLYELPMRSRLDLRPARRLARLVRAYGYQLIHTHTPRAALDRQAGRVLVQSAARASSA